MVFALSMVIFMTMTVLVCWQDRRYLHVAAMGPDRSGAVRGSEPCLLGTAQRKYSRVAEPIETTQDGAVCFPVCAPALIHLLRGLGG